MHNIFARFSEAYPDVAAKLKVLVDLFDRLLPDFPHSRLVITAALLLIALTLVFLVIKFLIGTLRNAFMTSPTVKGEKLYRKKKYDKAIRYFHRAANYHKVAQCFIKMEKFGEAAKFFEKAKEYDMAAKYYAHEGEYLRAANIYQMCGKILDAAEKFELAEDFETAGNLYRNLKYLKKAEEMYLKIPAPQKNAEMFWEELSEEKKKPPPPPTNDPEKDSRAREKRDILLGELAKKSGHYFSLTNEHKRAAQAFLEGSHIKEAAAAFHKAKDFANAAKHYLDCDLKREAAICYEKAENYDEALYLYKAVEEHEAAATVMEKMGQPNQAAEYRAMIELKRGQKIEAAQKYMQAGKLKEAADLYVSVKAFPKAAELFERLEDYAAAGDTYKMAEDLSKAATCYEKANRLSSAAQCFLKLGDEANYLKMLMKGEAFLEAGVYLLEKKDDEQAISTLQKIDLESPDYRYASNLLGRIFLKKGMITVASEKLETAVKDIQMDKSNPDLFYDLAKLRVEQGKYEEALKIYDNILAIDYHFKDVVKERSEVEKEIAKAQAQKTTQSTDTTSGMITGTGTLPAEAMQPPPGQDQGKLINQRYLIKGEIGRGGMGVVYKAEDNALQRLVALKFLPHALTPRKEDIDKFLNEARSAARLNHTNIVTVYDIDNDSESNSYFIVMEFVDGINLKEIIDSSHNLPFQVIGLIGKQICSALTYAHQKKVVHRDIKSANIIWTDEKIVKVTDFGLAKIVEKSLQTTTKAQGSPVYMSPEQVVGKNVDWRSDIYSFGISLYEMVTGKVPFDKGDIGYHHLNTTPTPPEEIRQDTPPYLAQLIMKCIEKKPESRFQNTAEILPLFEQQ